MSPRMERRLRAASAVVLAMLLGGGAWVELQALGDWLEDPAVCRSPGEAR